MTLAPSTAGRSLEVIAGRFHPPEQIHAIDALGSGNVNDTFWYAWLGWQGLRLL